MTAAPVAGGVIAGRVDKPAAVGRDRADVDPPAHDHDHAPAPRRASPEPGEDVVLDPDRGAEVEAPEPSTEEAEVGRKIGAGETEHRPLGDGPGRAVDPGLGRG